MGDQPGAGQHTLVFYGREDGTRLDRFQVELVSGQATSTPTPTPTATATVTNDLIFADGFESGSFSAWTTSTTDGGSWVSGSWQTISDAWRALEIKWQAASAAGANNGLLRLWLDGSQVSEQTGLDNDTRRVAEALLGAVGGIDNGTRGGCTISTLSNRGGRIISVRWQAALIKFQIHSPFRSVLNFHLT